MPEMRGTINRASPVHAEWVRNLMSCEYSMAAWQTRVNKKTRAGSV